MKSKLKLMGTAVLTAVFLTACSNNMYMPEAHTYANAIKNEMINAGACNSACSSLIRLNGFGWKFNRWSSGSVTVDVLGVNSKQLAERIIASCKTTKTKIPGSIPVTVNLYNTTTLDKTTTPILTTDCN